VRNLHPHWRRVVVPVALLPIVVGLASYGWFKLPDNSARQALRYVILAAALVILLWWTARPLLFWLSTRYIVTNRRVLIRSGVLSRTGRDIPLTRVNDVSFHRTLVERMFGSGTLTIESAEFHSEHLADAMGAKMSKRLGNIATLRDLLDAGHDPLAIRFFLSANAHYRSKLRMDEDAIRAAAEQVRRLRDFSQRVDRFEPTPADDAALVAALEKARTAYRAALDDDLNLPQGVGFLFDAVRESNSAIDRGAAGPAAKAAMRALLDDSDSHLDILRGGEVELETEVERLIAERETARAGRDFARADAIREELRSQGILLEDAKEGIRWRKA